jgi:hypothetical protein
MNTLPSPIVEHPFLFLLLVIWSIAWKGLGLWRAAEIRQKWWFIAILVLNTFGILEIIYLFLVARKYKVEVVEN